MLKKWTGPGIFRLFLALMVFADHISRFAIGVGAVYVFFCLSGYWIYQMYVHKYSNTRQPYLTYLVSRAWRLLPVFLLITGGVLVFVCISGTFGQYWNASNHLHFVVSNLLILGYDTLGKSLILPAWSLDVEMRFYLIAPLLAILLAKRRIPAALLLAAVGFLSLLISIFHVPSLLLRYLVFFMLGMTAASTNWRPSKRVGLISLGAAVLAFVACIASPWRGVLIVGAHPGPLAVYMLVANAVLAFMLAPYAIYTTQQKGFHIDGVLGDLSYVVYLLHWPAVLWISEHAGNVEHKLLASVESLVLVLMGSLLIWKFYDHPINRMRSRWVNSRKCEDSAPDLASVQKPSIVTPANV